MRRKSRLSGIRRNQPSESLDSSLPCSQTGSTSRTREKRVLMAKTTSSNKARSWMLLFTHEISSSYANEESVPLLPRPTLADAQHANWILQAAWHYHQKTQRPFHTVERRDSRFAAQTAFVRSSHSSPVNREKQGLPSDGHVQRQAKNPARRIVAKLCSNCLPSGCLTIHL